MFRPAIVCLPLLAFCAAAAADEAADAGKVQQRPALQKEQPKPVGQATAKARATKATGKESKQDAKPEADVKMSGMSVLGNEEAPKSLVIVPWKSSQLGDAPGLSKLLDDSTRPVDKDVFMRELAYYQIRSTSN